MANVNKVNSQQNYRTPRAFLDKVEERFGRITFDAACTSIDCVVEEPNSGFFYDAGVDALKVNWFNDRPCGVTWCNPPFAKAKAFARKIASEYESASLQARTLLLVPAGLDTHWFWSYVHGRALVLMLSPRIPFLNPDLTPVLDSKGRPAAINRPMMLAVYGVEPGFERWIWQPTQPRKKKNVKVELQGTVLPDQFQENL